MSSLAEKLAAMPEEKRLYLLEMLPTHSVKAGMPERAKQLLLDVGYLQSRLIALNDTTGIGTDCGVLVRDPAMRIMRSFWQVSAHILSDRENHDQLYNQLIGRLGLHEDNQPDIAALMQAVREDAENHPDPMLLLQQPTFDPAGGALVRTLRAHTDCVSSISIDGDYLASASWDNTVIVWNWSTGDMVIRIPVDTILRDILIRASIRGDYVFIESQKGSHIWNWRKGEYAVGKSTSIPPYSLVSGRYCIAFQNNGLVKVWDWKSMEILCEISTVAMRKCRGVDDEKLHLITWDEKSLELWDMKTAQRASFDAMTHIEPIHDYAIYGEWLFVIAKYDPAIVRWNWLTGERFFLFEDYHDMRQSSFETISVTGEQVLVGTSRGKLYLLKWNDDKLIATVAAHSDKVTIIESNESHVFTGSWDCDIKVWSLEHLSGVTVTKWHSDVINSLDMQGRFALSASYDSTVAICNVEKPTKNISYLRGHQGMVLGAVFYGDLVFSHGADGTVRIWDWHSAKEVKSIICHSTYVTTMALAGTDHLITGSIDKSVIVWNWKTGQQIRRFGKHTLGVDRVYVSGDLVISADRQVSYLWNWQTEEDWGAFNDNGQGSFPIAFDNNEIFFAWGDSTIWVWDLSKNIRTKHLQDTGKVIAARLYGNFLLTTHSDKSLKIWNWTNEQCLGTFFFESRQLSIAIQGDMIVSSCESGQIHFLRPNAALRRLMQIEDILPDNKVPSQ